mmetsp:Transcript_56968/g.162295  ORF Transcript_56968/g.162295 Transcript_56968/m.162295 type:complete len:129 (-) Transcript_56968:226-612(-)
MGGRLLAIACVAALLCAACPAFLAPSARVVPQPPQQGALRGAAERAAPDAPEATARAGRLALGAAALGLLVGLSGVARAEEGKQQWTKGGVKKIPTKEERLQKAKEKMQAEAARKSMLKKDGTFKNGA